MVVVEERDRTRVRPAPVAQPEPPPVEEREPSLLRTVTLFLPALALIIAFEIALMFTVAYLVTGRAY